MSPGRLLTLNAGSSSLKFGVYGSAAELPLLLAGQVSGLGGAARFRARAGATVLADEPWSDVSAFDAALERLFEWLTASGWDHDLQAVGHRIVHGGLAFRRPIVLTPEVVDELARLSALAPLHQPFNLRACSRAAARYPAAIQVGVFDTAFHADQPRTARLYGLPRSLAEEGVLAYGFHGLSYAYIADQLRSAMGAAAGGRAIVLHLGSGVSLCALQNGRSVATTMGFSALDGPPMSTRSGALDPGVVLHLLQAKGLSVDQVTDLLYHRSGLLGLSGLTGDMVALLASDHPHAREALDVYTYRLAREIGSLTAALGGLDTLVFTAGVGENAPAIRRRVAELSGWLGVRLDDAANEAGARSISRPDSGVQVLVIPTDEQVVIARGVLERLSPA
ncbi:acetate/propionate family kinase [Phenylobacterium sp. VNQ135]|uniref:acetate/propionate family kinase n=1 Tax=Phenylobacterium sp. VNQ135 TaxID=3400922 RepID=UPI003BFF9E11